MRSSWSVLRNAGRWVRETLDTEITTKVKHLVGTIVVGFVVVGLVLTMIENNGQADRERDARTAALLSYQAEVRAYETQLDQYLACLSKVETRVTLRGLFIDQNDTLRRVLEVIDEQTGADPALMAQLYAEVDASAQRIDVEYPEYPPDECPPSPPAPPPVPEQQ